MKVWVNTIVKNEENFIWYGVMSIIEYVDKVLIYDTGSSDRTLKLINILKESYPEKIIFKQIKIEDNYQYTQVRQEMLEKSDCDWVIILDGDEVWWKESISKIIEIIQKKNKELDAIIVPFFNMVGDLYHYQSEEAGKYKIQKKKGHLTIKALNRKIEGLHVGGPYGSESYLDAKNVPIQQRDNDRLLFLNAPFMHMTHLKRSALDDHNKYKYDLGIRIPNNFKLPEIFYRNKPAIVPNVLSRRTLIYKLISLLKFPLTFLWRRMTN